MNLVRWLEIMYAIKCEELCCLVILALQVLLWIGLVRLHIDLGREDIFWEECIGKIRSALTRKLNGKEELDMLKRRNYSPIVNDLLAISFDETRSSTAERCILLRWNVQDGLRFYFIRWLNLLIAFLFLVVVSIFCKVTLSKDGLLLTGYQIMSLCVWLLYAVFLVRKQIVIWKWLERVQCSLLLPSQD